MVKTKGLVSVIIWAQMSTRAEMQARRIALNASGGAPVALRGYTEHCSADGGGSYVVFVFEWDVIM